MLSLREEQNILVVVAAGRLNRADYERFAVDFAAVLARRRRMPMLIDASGLDGWEIEALWEDLKFDLGYRDRFGAMAVLCDERLQGCGTWFAKPLARPDVRYFKPGEIDHAHAWLLSTHARR